MQELLEVDEGGEDLVPFSQFKKLYFGLPLLANPVPFKEEQFSKKQVRLNFGHPHPPVNKLSTYHPQ